MPPGTAVVGRDDAADGRAVRTDRIERQPLTLAPQNVVDGVERGAGGNGGHQISGDVIGGCSGRASRARRRFESPRALHDAWCPLRGSRRPGPGRLPTSGSRRRRRRRPAGTFPPSRIAPPRRPARAGAGGKGPALLRTDGARRKHLAGCRCRWDRRRSARAASCPGRPGRTSATSSLLVGSDAVLAGDRAAGVRSTGGFPTPPCFGVPPGRDASS